MTQAPLRLGVIGLSDGNGHPYSWSAIFNGYDASIMAACPFPVIPKYLAEQRFPAAAIAGARVTHVWAERSEQAAHIAAAALIDTVVDDYRDMIGAVDGILLARDDGERHVEMSVPFLDAGLPIYIDKPIALSRADLDVLYAHRRYDSQIFSCSAMRFAAEFRLSAGDRSALGAIGRFEAATPNTWQRYGAHPIDAVLAMFDLYDQDCEVTAARDGDRHVVHVAWPSLSGSFTCSGAQPSGISVDVIGATGSLRRVFTNTFDAFKAALEQFVIGIRTHTEITTRQQLAAMVSILERGSRVN